MLHFSTHHQHDQRPNIYRCNPDPYIFGYMEWEADASNVAVLRRLKEHDMERNHELDDGSVVDLGIASVETQGQGGLSSDTNNQPAQLGISDE